MADKREIITSACRIEKLLSEKNFQDIECLFCELEEVCVTVEHFQETNIIKAVYRVLKNCPESTVKKKAKNLLAKWKKLYQRDCLLSEHHGEERSSQETQESEGLSNLSDQKEKSCHRSVKDEVEHHRQESSSQETQESEGLSKDSDQKEKLCHSSVENEVSTVASLETPCSSLDVPKDVMHKTVNLDVANEAVLKQTTVPPESVPHEEVFEKAQVNERPIRSKCSELLLQALLGSEVPSQMKAELCQGLARSIEEHVFAFHGKNNKKYRACIRSKVANLKNPKTPHLRENLLLGVLTPETFAEMTVMEMASEELKKLRASYTESSVQEHQLPQGVEGAKTTKIKCRRCEKFDCTVTVIARGTLFLPGWVRNGNPDEQMMTFVICNECGEKWYNSGWICL
ncbi:transcription elongation factor A N-terminal and central domain-containing protein [Latimeria chalumnae]|uniref:transcription elongation factor A N-terminal and central domain-containing protein n=1 Tax=Latimeria chalumnae TaxID=7897 RepID=UPI0003C10864|nr:PREDICTED: transcription elongation factor A N-terminal and central domain-containing protein [Latimeria chalumnae]|eukprot:XP_005996204.1 PREDICTED: transcription elongation factor A N-terminal and central domain-containing protein [Latimeria chalumnae]